MARDQHEILKEITENGFAVTDLGLYLDNHPTDVQALKMFDECSQKYKEAMKEYAENFEPLRICDVKPGAAVWAWNDAPVPWEGGVCSCGVMKNV